MNQTMKRLRVYFPLLFSRGEKGEQFIFQRQWTWNSLIYQQKFKTTIYFGKNKIASVPETIIRDDINYTVDTIGYTTFCNNKKITSASMPNTIVKIQ